MNLSFDALLVIAGGVSGSIVSFFAGRGKNKAEAERTLSEAWDRYSASLEERIKTLVSQVDTHTQLISQQNQTIAEQNTTIATQNSRIAAQDKLIHEQSIIIEDLSQQVVSLGAVPVHKKTRSKTEE